MRSIQQNIESFTQAGVTPVAISVDSIESNRDLAQQYGFTFPILSDPHLDAIRAYDLVHEDGVAKGEAIARPAEFLIDSTRTVQWLNLTENYWVRANVEDMLEKAKALK